MSFQSAPRSRGIRRGTVVGFILIPAMLAAMPALALPRYTAQYGQDCKLCHVNPTGGGMRELYASQFIVPEELAARGWSAEETEVLGPDLGSSLTFGLDFRTLLQQQEAGAGTLLAMQGDLYLAANLGYGLQAYFEQGLRGSGEIFAAWRGLPADGYVKAGRFLPDYGWRFADHRMFTRRFLFDVDGTDALRGFYASGIELGIAPGPVTITGSVQGETESTGDAYASRVLWHLRLGPVNAGVGGSILRRDRAGADRRAVGGIWYLAAGPVTWLGEVDETRGDELLGNLVVHELTVRIARGLDLRGTYGFQDPDRHLRSGTRERYGGGLTWMPLPVFSLLAMGNYWDIEEGSLVTGDSYLEGELVLHVFY